MSNTFSLKQFLDTRDGAGRGSVVIPVIQRDYAQGRKTEAAVRERFLLSLRAALNAEVGRPLVLDFVYGAERLSHQPGETEFLPLDGQQRLTTLWLLHWYLAQREAHGDEFRKFALHRDESGNAGSARFTYEVRPSSKEFFSELARRNLPLPPTSTPAQSTLHGPLAAALVEQPWFLLSWLADPTVQASLTMLDAIHAHFHDCHGGYGRLCNDEHPAVVFHLLNLDRYGLTDDLYIKMNARGRPLTEFEVFKAELEKHLATDTTTATYNIAGKPVTARDYVSQRWDTAWSDLLWPFRGTTKQGSQTVDTEGMNLIRSTSMAMLPWFSSAAPAVVNTRLLELRDSKFKRFADYQTAGCMPDEYLRALVRLLDHWSGEQPQLTPIVSSNELGDLFKRALIGPQVGSAKSSGLDFVDLIRFAAYCEGVLRGLAKADLAVWMLYFRKLADNTIYDNTDEVRPALTSIRAFPEVALGQAMQVISETLVVSGFLGQQVREERLKAQLRLQDRGWGYLIDTAEAHPYFAGQIEFLLDFAGVLEKWKSAGESVGWPAEEHKALQAVFHDYFKRAAIMFDVGGLTKPSAAVAEEFLWERSLLSFGNFLLPSKDRNHGFLDASDRNASWKRLLRAPLKQDEPSDENAQTKRGTVKSVLDRIKAADVEGSLREIIQAAMDKGVSGPTTSATWRQMLVNEPSHLHYCLKRQVRFVGAAEPYTQIFLMCKRRRTGEHRELYAHHLYLRLLRTYGAGRVAVTTATNDAMLHVVGVSLASGTGHIYVSPYKGEYWLQLPEGMEIHEGVKARMSDGQPRRWIAGPDDIETVIDLIVATVDAAQQPGS